MSGPYTMCDEHGEIDATYCQFCAERDLTRKLESEQLLARGYKVALESAKRELDRLIPIAARAESAELQVGDMREALQAIYDICKRSGDPHIISIGSIAKRGLKVREDYAETRNCEKWDGDPLDGAQSVCGLPRPCPKHEEA